MGRSSSMRKGAPASSTPASARFVAIGGLIMLFVVASLAVGAVTILGWLGRALF
jgi:hypothetical protein